MHSILHCAQGYVLTHCSNINRSSNHSVHFKHSLALFAWPPKKTRWTDWTQWPRRIKKCKSTRICSNGSDSNHRQKRYEPTNDKASTKCIPSLLQCHRWTHSTHFIHKRWFFILIIWYSNIIACFPLDIGKCIADWLSDAHCLLLVTLSLNITLLTFTMSTEQKTESMTNSKLSIHSHSIPHPHIIHCHTKHRKWDIQFTAKQDINQRSTANQSITIPRKLPSFYRSTMLIHNTKDKISGTKTQNWYFRNVSSLNRRFNHWNNVRIPPKTSHQTTAQRNQQNYFRTCLSTMHISHCRVTEWYYSTQHADVCIWWSIQNTQNVQKQ